MGFLWADQTAPEPPSRVSQLIGAFSPAAYGVKKNVSQPPTVTSTGVSTSAGEY